MFLPKQVSFVQYSDNAKTEFKLNSYRDKGVAMAALHLIRYQGGNTKTGGLAGGCDQSLTSARLFSHELSLSWRRNGAQTHVRKGLLFGKRAEEKRPKAGGGHHRRTLSGRGEEERHQAAASR